VWNFAQYITNQNRIAALLIMVSQLYFATGSFAGPPLVVAK